MTSLNEYDVSKRWTAVVQDSQRITPERTDEVRNILLQVREPGFPYQVGQSVGVLIPGPHAFGNPFHMRLYSIADGHSDADGGTEIELCVRRCFYLDEVSGERYAGVASNALCDARPGDAFTLTGPFKSPFSMPPSDSNNLLMIGTGTGVAPFRALVREIYSHHPNWHGQVRLYYGARTGMEILYQNDQNDDMAQYYDQATYQAIAGLSQRPVLGGEADAIQRTVQEHAQDIWTLIQDENTYVYLAGLERISDALDKVMPEVAGSAGRWRWARQELREQGRWSELLYI
jgi:ferredoxin--NADP+ reductase